MSRYGSIMGGLVQKSEKRFLTEKQTYSKILLVTATYPITTALVGEFGLNWSTDSQSCFLYDASSATHIKLDSWCRNARTTLILVDQLTRININQLFSQRNCFFTSQALGLIKGKRDAAEVSFQEVEDEPSTGKN